MESNTLLFDPANTKIGHKLCVRMYKYYLSKYGP